MTSRNGAPPDLSIVIACYNGERIIEEGIAEIDRAMQASRYSYELVFVDDCSTDGTREVIRKVTEGRSDCQVLLHEVNRGRGKTVTDGLRISRGEVCGFVDIDLATSAVYIPELVSRVLSGYDVAMAWRIYKLHWHIVDRWILSRGYHFLVRFVLKLPLEDTETGFKFFRRTRILPVLAETKDEGWFWDTEICSLAYHHGLSIFELPTLYLRRKAKGSTVKILRDSYRYFVNLMSFAPRWRRMRHQ